MREPLCSLFVLPILLPMARDFITLSEMSQAVLGITCDLCQRREQFDVDTSHRSQNAAVVTASIIATTALAIGIDALELWSARSLIVEQMAPGF